MSTKKEEVKDMSMQDNLSEMIKAMQERLDKLEGENKELKAAAAPMSKEELSAAAKKYEEKEKVYVPMDKGILKEDVFVAVNGERVLIQRGKNVMVKKKFKRAIELSEMQRADAVRLIVSETEKYDKASSILNL